MGVRLKSHYYFMKLALISSHQATCRRRQVGCILVDEHKHIIATGYNGVASGITHCINKPCGGENFKSGEGLEHCQAIHAEQNALLQCKDVQSIEVAYCTTVPCPTCLKLLMNTSCREIVYLNAYPGSEKSKLIWEGLGNVWTKLHQTEDLMLVNK